MFFFLNSQSAHSAGARKCHRIQCTQKQMYMLKSAHFKCDVISVFNTLPLILAGQNVDILFLWDCKSISICGSLKNSGQLSDKQWSSWEFLTGNQVCNPDVHENLTIFTLLLCTWAVLTLHAMMNGKYDYF